MDENGITDQVRDRRERMAGRNQDTGIHLSDLEALAVLEQVIPLRAIGRQRRPIVDFLPQRLHVDDMFADRGRSAGHALQILRGREMVGMRMSIEDPRDAEVLLLDIVEDFIGTPGRGRVRLFVEIKDGVDDGAAVASPDRKRPTG